MNAQHTPGPWRIVGTGEWPSVQIYGPRDDSPGSLNNFAVAIGVQSDADARLIASAPELLEALENALNALAFHAEMHPVGMDCVFVQKAKEAIAKARGQA